MSLYGSDSNGQVANHLSNGPAQEVISGVASAESTVFGGQTKIIRIVNLVACRYVVGTSPQTALATNTLLLPNVIEYLSVEPGQVIAAIQDSAAGSLNVTECG